jgi:hypothetical protein
MSKNIEIGKPLTVEVSWYDKCTVPPADKKFEGEIIGWRNTQVIVSVRTGGRKQGLLPARIQYRHGSLKAHPLALPLPFSWGIRNLL